MKKFFIYISIALSLAACGSEDTTDSATTTGNASIQVEIENPVRLGDAGITRSSLTYDDAAEKMMFTWDDDDCIGVFTYTDAEHSQQLKFTQIKADTDTELHRTFMTNDGALNVPTDKQYVACLPYFSGHSINYTNIPVTYTGQRQTEPVDFSNYWNDPDDADYKASQKKASAHLTAYDYLCTGPTTPTSYGGINFKMNRMGAIVRFWIQINPNDNYVYDELQLMNPSKAFTTEATMNAETLTLTPTASSNIISLKLGYEGIGFDMTIKSNDETKSTSPFYDWYNDTYTGYIMAYMMLAPIDLSAAETEKSVVYLIAHEKESPADRHYFKSKPLSKPNLTSNKFYQWSMSSMPEESPISFQEITVEEWRKGSDISNGDNGAGTGSW